MAHDHDHHHGAPADPGPAFAVGIGLNTLFVAAEVAAGLAGHSVALLSDAAHNLGDVLGLVLSWAAVVLARGNPTRRRSYGYRKATVLAALVNAVLVLAALIGIVLEATARLTSPAAVDGVLVMAVAGLGAVINGVSAWFFLRSPGHDLNLRANFWHLATDALVSLGVVASGLVLLLTGWTLVDPLVSLLIALVVLVGTWGLLTQAVNLALDAVPPAIDLAQVQAFLEGLPGVAALHDLHVWALSTTEVALTVHLAVPGPTDSDDLLRRVAEGLHDRFEITHTTVQIEKADEACQTNCD